MIPTAALDPVGYRLLQDLLRRVTYKQGWRFALRKAPGFGVELHIAARLPDAIGRIKGELIPVQKLVPVPPYIDDRTEFLRWLEGEVIEFERHEVHEWLKLDGRCITEPHPELRGMRRG